MFEDWAERSVSAARRIEFSASFAPLLSNMAARGNQTITKAAELLQQASTMLLSVNENLSETGSSSTATSGNSPGTSAATIVPEIRDTLERAKSMMATSSNAGLYKRLNKNERLRAAAGKSSSKGSTSSKTVKTARSLEKKPFEFALLRASDIDSDGEEEDNLRKDHVINRGIVTLTASDTEKVIREKVVSSLKTRYPMIESRDFEFVKVVQKKISVLQMGKGTEYDYTVVKKLAGQGLLYIRMKQVTQFAVDESLQVEEDMAEDPCGMCTLPNPFNSPTTSIDLTSTQNVCNVIPDGTSVGRTPLENDQRTLSAQPVQKAGPADPEIELSPFFTQVLDEMPASANDPTEMLRFLQGKILSGRDLDVSDESSELSGDTNYISVDRDNVLETTFSELKDVKDPRITFEVQFYGEEAEDRGGPRKEWIRLCNQKIQLKYFEQGLKEHLASDYFYVGQMAAIALLQNGQLPVYFPETALLNIFADPYPSTHPCISSLQKGLDSLGIHAAGRKFPQLLDLFIPSVNAKLSVKKLLQLLTPKFSEKGSNTLKYEKIVYACFVKYVREVASGRRVTKLENILEFTTCASEEPLLGFALSPSIEFIEATCASREPRCNSEERESQNQV